MPLILSAITAQKTSRAVRLFRTYPRGYFLIKKQFCKPGSVLDDYLSVALYYYKAQAIGREVPSRLNFTVDVAPDGVYTGIQLPSPLWALTSHFHNHRINRHLFSVALSLESPPPGVTRHPALRSPDFPHAFSCPQSSELLFFWYNVCIIYHIITILSRKTSHAYNFTFCGIIFCWQNIILRI